jgi:hypothetical protein
MRHLNPVQIGLKRHSSARKYFDELKKQIERDGAATAVEWDWYRARQREWEPEVLAAEMAAAGHRIDLEHARKLSIEDLQAILDEKCANQQIRTET